MTLHNNNYKMAVRGHFRVYEDGFVTRWNKDGGYDVPPTYEDRGYLYTSYTKDGETRVFPVHRLVAMAWLKNPSEKQYVVHLDGNKKNNVPSNLVWATRTEMLAIQKKWNTGNKTHSEPEETLYYEPKPAVKDENSTLMSELMQRVIDLEKQLENACKSAPAPKKARKRNELQQLMDERGIKTKVLADYMDMTPGGVARKIRETGDLKISEIATTAHVLEMDVKTVFNAAFTAYMTWMEEKR